MGKWYDDEVTQAILHKKYLHEGENSFDDLVNRVSSIYSEDIREDVKTALYNADLSPAGRTLYAAGMKGKEKLTLSNCFVNDVCDDTLEDISRLDYEIARIGSMGGGIGFCVDNIRPKGAKINNAAQQSDGVAFVMRKINETGQIVGQRGRGLALMCGISCNHPDILEFLNIKKSHESLASMNISIKFTDEFMQAVVDNKEYELHFTIEATGEEIKKTINAKDFFEEFCRVNWDVGDPGCIFIDRVRSYNLVSGYKDYVINICNPCAEYFGNDGNSCLLQSINLYNLVDNKFESNASVNYDKLEHLVRLSIRMMNQTQDYGYDMLPLDKNRKNVDDWRSIGLGVFGLADMLIALKLKYGSKEALEVIADIFDKINLWALDESCNEAKKYGTFGKYNWESQKKSPLIQALLLSDEGRVVYEKIEKYGLRNSSLLSCAPTGTISLFMGRLSGGVEPLFKCGYDRTSHQGENKNVVFRVFSRSIEDLLTHEGLPHTLSNEEIKEKFDWVVESQDITPIDRIATQSVMNEYIDNAISSTINLPNSATWQDIFNIYVNAWKQKCKGITIFRDGCSRGNILGVDTSKKETKEEPIYDTVVPVSRRGVQEVSGSTFRLKTACVDKFYIHINKTDEGELFEIFANPSSGCQSNIGTITRLVSMALRSGIKVSEIIKELRSMKCPACQTLRARGEKDIELSCGNAIAHALELAYNKETKMVIKEVKENNETEGLLECPQCHKKTLRPEGKCFTCGNCGYSRCD